MRLIGEFQTDKEVLEFQTFLTNHGIGSIYDVDAQSVYRVWVVEEDDIEAAAHYLAEWKKGAPWVEPAVERAEEGVSSQGSSQWKFRIDLPKSRSPFSLNNFLILLCFFISIWYWTEEGKVAKGDGIFQLSYVGTPLGQVLMYDDPLSRIQLEKFFQEYPIKSAQDLQQLPSKAQSVFKKIIETPEWIGFAGMFETHQWKLLEKMPDGTLFRSIREGEAWRLFTPVLLHANFLHVLFNIMLLFVVGRQIEERIGIFRYLILSLLLGIFSNTAQYLMTGPAFIGYSGIITGLFGFVWMRQKVAPWEGYPLPSRMMFYLAAFVLAMGALGLYFMIANFFQSGGGQDIIANTAHIAGALAGIFLGRLPLFERNLR